MTNELEEFKHNIQRAITYHSTQNCSNSGDNLEPQALDLLFAKAVEQVGKERAELAKRNLTDAVDLPSVGTGKVTVAEFPSVLIQCTHYERRGSLDEGALLHMLRQMGVGPAEAQAKIEQCRKPSTSVLSMSAVKQ